MIDLRSDTLTRPGKEMLEAILSAQLGDAGRRDADGRGEDPTVNQLEDYAAALLHKEAAAFVCSGTMGNSAALLTCCRPGDKVLVGKHLHVYQTEQFAMEPRFGQLTPVFYTCTETGLPVVESVRAQMEAEDVRLLHLENTLNFYGGTAIPLEVHRALYELAHRRGVWVHLDGARLFNAALALGVEAWEIAQYADSVMFCVSKGIGAPFGSLVCGPKAFIRELRTTQTRLGGGLRQAGVVAAPALYALRHQLGRLAEDHRRAAALAGLLQGLKHVHPQERIDSNIVMLHIVGCTGSDFCERLKRHGVLAGAPDESKVRLVFYKGISDEDITAAAEIIRAVDRELG